MTNVIHGIMHALESVLFAIRTLVQASSKYSPYEVAFGRKVALPLEHVMQIHKTVSSLNDTVREALYKQLHVQGKSLYLHIWLIVHFKSWLHV